MRVFARKVWRIGVLTLFEEAGRYWVRCYNRTYDHTHEVPPEKLNRWLRLVKTGK